jgi:hypothetical protein
MAPQDETLHNRLARLSEAATQSDLADKGRYFSIGLDDLTQCHHGETGEYREKADGEFIEALWNAYRAGELLVRPSGEPAANTCCGVAPNIGRTCSGEVTFVSCGICSREASDLEGWNARVDTAVSCADPTLIEARDALAGVEAWWLEDGMNHFNGAPIAIFSTRSVLPKLNALIKGGTA